MKKLHKLALRIAYQGLRVYWYICRPKTEGVRCLVLHENNILLIQHSYGPKTWTIPGGGIKSGETRAEATVREVREEVGISIDHPTEHGAVFYDGEYKKDTVWVLTTKTTSTNYKIDGTEIIAAKWFPLSEIPSNKSILLDQFIEVSGLTQSTP